MLSIGKKKERKKEKNRDSAFKPPFSADYGKKKQNKIKSKEKIAK